MVVMAVDPNKKDLKLLVKYLRMVYPECEVVMFTNSTDASRYIRDNPIDVLFTEAAMFGMTGFGLKEATEAVQPAVPTVFVTATDAYAGEAIKTRAAGYILKPVTREAIRQSLEETRFKVKLAHAQ